MNRRHKWQPDRVDTWKCGDCRRKVPYLWQTFQMIFGCPGAPDEEAPGIGDS